MTSSTMGSSGGNARPFARRENNQNPIRSGSVMPAPIDHPRQKLRTDEKPNRTQGGGQ